MARRIPEPFNDLANVIHRTLKLKDDREEKPLKRLGSDQRGSGTPLKRGVNERGEYFRGSSGGVFQIVTHTRLFWFT